MLAREERKKNYISLILSFILLSTWLSLGRNHYCFFFFHFRYCLLVTNKSGFRFKKRTNCNLLTCKNVVKCLHKIEFLFSRIFFSVGWNYKICKATCNTFNMKVFMSHHLPCQKCLLIQCKRCCWACFRSFIIRTKMK